MDSDRFISEKVEESLKLLDEAFSEVLSTQEIEYPTGKLGRAIGMLREFQSPIYQRNPELRPLPPWHNIEVPALTEEQKAITSRISNEELERIDSELLSLLNKRYQKVAKVVLTYISKNDNRIPGAPDLFYGYRIKHMAEAGKIEFQGNLDFMQYCEVRILKA